MYELTISISTSKSNVIEKIVKELESDVKLSGGVIVFGLFDGRAQASLAVKDNKKDFIKAKALNIVADNIVSIYKFEYLSENITTGMLKQKDSNLLIRALTEFDKSTDIELVKKNLVFSNNIIIDSVYYFRLYELKERWNEIVKLVNSNLANLVASDTLSEMMKFLISASPYKTDEIYILLKDNLINVLDRANNQTINMKFNAKDSETEQKLINFLIKLSPRKIYISNELYQKLEYMSKIENLFDGRVFITI